MNRAKLIHVALIGGLGKLFSRGISQMNEIEEAQIRLACVLTPSEMKKISAKEMNAIGLRLVYEHITRGGTLKEES